LPMPDWHAFALPSIAACKLRPSTLSTWLCTDRAQRAQGNSKLPGLRNGRIVDGGRNRAPRAAQVIEPRQYRS
jgi:hypothetical protein